MPYNDDAWKILAIGLEAGESGVDLETVLSDPLWSANAIEKYESRAREGMVLIDTTVEFREAGVHLDE